MPQNATRILVPVLLLAVLGLAFASPARTETLYQNPQCVDINAAGFEALQEIIHIGPERARQIIQLRRERPFASVDELVRVRGIAEARLRDIKEQGLACVVPPGLASDSPR